MQQQIAEAIHSLKRLSAFLEAHPEYEQNADLDDVCDICEEVKVIVSGHTCESSD